MTAPDPTDPLVVGAWSQVAEGYSAYWGPRFEPFVAEALRVFEPGPGPLGVPGCGPGEEALALADRFPAREVIATDPSTPMLDLLRARLASTPRANLRVHQGAAVELVDLLGGAGGVFSSCVLQLLPDPGAALEAWGRCLGPGGRIAALFWPRQIDTDAWGRLGRAIEASSAQARPDWEIPLRERLPSLGLRLTTTLDVTHEIAYASPVEAWTQLRDACSMQVLLQRLGPQAAQECGARWLADSGLEERAGRWVHRPTARLWLLSRATPA